MTPQDTRAIAFIGGGNMAQALIGGLLQSGVAASTILVVDPSAEQRARLAQTFGLAPLAAAAAPLSLAGLVVWAVKPQFFAAAAAPCKPFVGEALQLSVMAGVRCQALVAASGSTRVVRAMPNTPALIGQGIAGLYAEPAVDGAERSRVEALFTPTGQWLWVEREADLDAVTAVSGSGPAYVFYVLEAMVQAAVELGLSEAQGRQLAQATVGGAAALAKQSTASLADLRAQVTSKGGTTHAAITSLQADAVAAAFVRALHAARDRAVELGRGG
ncbi:MAG: pyrroline-5-carboxylate reductase [Rubrivivax sp.]